LLSPARWSMLRRWRERQRMFLGRFVVFDWNAKV
jgi:hypothetical protein